MADASGLSGAAGTPHTKQKRTENRLRTWRSETALVKAFKFKQAIFKNGQLLHVSYSLKSILFRLRCQTSNFLFLEIVYHFRVQQRRQFSNEAMFEGENAHIAHELLQSNLHNMSAFTILSHRDQSQ